MHKRDRNVLRSHMKRQAATCSYGYSMNLCSFLLPTLVSPRFGLPLALKWPSILGSRIKKRTLHPLTHIFVGSHQLHRILQNMFPPKMSVFIAKGGEGDTEMQTVSFTVNVLCIFHFAVHQQEQLLSSILHMINKRCS